jgi:hypothetical protein
LDYNDFVVTRRDRETNGNINAACQCAHCRPCATCCHGCRGSSLSRRLQLQSSSSSNNKTAETNQQMWPRVVVLVAQSPAIPITVTENSMDLGDDLFRTSRQDTALFIVRRRNTQQASSHCHQTLLLWCWWRLGHAFREAMHAAAEQEQHYEQDIAWNRYQCK